MKTSLTVHTIVKNEEKWIWYALMSVKDYADVIYVYDTGSIDKTVEIIKSIKDPKIKFEQKMEVDKDGLTKLRQEQLDRTKTDWFLLVDGDEIWPDKTIKEFLTKIGNSDRQSWGVVIRAWNLIGDIYHHHPESESYHWPYAPKNYLGWANLRGFNKKEIQGLCVKGDYPQEAYYDDTNTPIQNYGSKHLIFLENRYFHTSYLQRSSSRQNDKLTLNRTLKNKIELGKKFKIIDYPKAFSLKRSLNVASPWQKRSFIYFMLALFITPLKKIKRRFAN